MKFIVDFKNSASQQDIDSYFSQNNLTIVQTFNNFEKIFLVDATITPPATDIIEHVVQDDDHHITLLNTTILSDQTYGTKTLTGATVTITNDQQQWWKSYVIKNPDLDAPSYSIDRRGQNATVYVLDSGIEVSHPEFVGKNVVNLWSFNNDFTDKKGHGTAIASVIAGTTIGLTDATVKAVKIFDPDTPTKQSDMLNGLDAIFQDVMDNQLDFTVVNCSWTISKNTLIESKMRSMIDAGIFIVAAAGNSGHAIDDVTPASMDEVITIGAFNSSLSPCDFSNYSNPSIISVTSSHTNTGALDGWAPGEQIYTAGLNGSYGFVNGTSIAAGIHSAIVAYNLGYFVPEDRAGMSYKDFYTMYSLSRKDLLNLSDPKYSSSKNFISTLHDELYLPNAQSYSWLIKGTAGEFIRSTLFNPQYVVSLEILGDLPDQYTITPQGKFYGKTLEIETDYTYFTVPIKLTKVDGEIFETDLEIITTKSGVDTSSIETGDPVLNVKLQTAFNCSFSYVTCYNPSSGDSCNSFTCYPADCYYLYPDKLNCGSYTQASCVCTL